MVAFSIAVPGFLTLNSIADISRQAGEIGFVVLALTLVMIVGGIDLSVGSTFALSNLTALYLINVAEMPIWVAIPGTLLVGSLLGGVNGVLIGYFRLRAFLTTLITLIVFRAAYDLLTFKFATAIASGFPDAPVWDFVGSGNVFGIPTVACFYLAVAIAGHIFLTRLRPGWHINAIGGSRRSAYNTGIAVRRTVALCYVGSGALTALGALFFASRLNSAGGDIGVGLEITVLTAAVLGGISLGGGKGSVTKAAVGTLIVLIVINGLVNLGLVGGINRMVLAATLLTAAAVDIRWLKNKHRIVSKVYVSPAYHKLPPLISTKPDSGTAWALNDKLHDVDVIGLGQVEGAEDVILDRHDNLYGGSRLGDIVRFFPPDYKRMEIYAHIGGARWVWRSINTIIFTCALAAWVSIELRRTVKWRKRRTKLIAVTPLSMMIVACDWPMTSTLLMMAGSFSLRPLCAMRCMTGRSMGLKRVETAKSSATTRTQTRPILFCAT